MGVRGRRLTLTSSRDSHHCERLNSPKRHSALYDLSPSSVGCAPEYGRDWRSVHRLLQTKVAHRLTVSASWQQARPGCYHLAASNLGPLLGLGPAVHLRAPSST